MNTPANPELFELAPEEIVVPLRVLLPAGSGRPLRVTHFFRPPALEDWLAYDRALKLTIREGLPAQAGADEASVFHSQAAEAAALLWQRTIRRAEGYGRKAGLATAEARPGAPPDWWELIPLEHKQQAVRGLALVEVEPARNDELYPLDLETREVRLRAHRNGRWSAGLTHCFRRPTTEDELAYRRILSELYVLRGSGETRVPPRLGALVRLYDRLILRVEGYARQGVALEGTAPEARATLVAAMDALHKRVAMEALFGELSTLEADHESAAIEKE